MGVVDDHYRDDDTARAALASYDDITMTSPVLHHIAELTDVEPYVPGAFYRRELPGILAGTSKTPNALARVDRLARMESPEPRTSDSSNPTILNAWPKAPIAPVQSTPKGIVTIA